MYKRHQPVVESTEIEPVTQVVNVAEEVLGSSSSEAPTRKPIVSDSKIFGNEDPTQDWVLAEVPPVDPDSEVPVDIQVAIAEAEAEDTRVAQLIANFDTTTEPASRQEMITEIAQWYVRNETMLGIEWALALPNPEEQKRAIAAINEHALVGIGAVLSTSEEGYPSIARMVQGGAAMMSEVVQDGDVIVSVIDANGNKVSTLGRSMVEVAQWIRGAPGTSAKLEVQRIDAQGNKVIVPVEILRQLIPMTQAPVEPEIDFDEVPEGE